MLPSARLPRKQRATKGRHQRQPSAEVHAAVSTTCDGLLLRTCVEICTGEKVLLKIILDNSAAKRVLLRSRVGRIRHLSCRVLWIQQSVKLKQLETCAIPTMLMDVYTVSQRRLNEMDFPHQVCEKRCTCTMPCEA